MQLVLPHVVFLANDAVYNQGLAFLESFRRHNPSTPLSMIPFANDISGLEAASKVYNFDVLQIDTARWDDLGREFFPRSEKKYRNRLRKLAVFDVQSPTTIYLDLDTVVLRNLSFISAKIIDGTSDFICCKLANDPWVYNESYKAHDKLKGAKRFSDGFFAFAPGKLDADLAYQVLVENKELYRSVRAERVFCQPCTNFVVDMLGLRVSEISSLYANISPEVWYEERTISEMDGCVATEDGKELLFVHWAGPIDYDTNFRMKGLYLKYLSDALARLNAHGLDSHLALTSAKDTRPRWSRRPANWLAWWRGGPS